MSHDKRANEEAHETPYAQPESKESASDTLSEGDQGLHDNSNVPKMSYLKVFWFFFYNFGLFAWGGPGAALWCRLP